jgi:hypothetical protein
MRFAEIVHTPRLSWLAGALVLTLGSALALRTSPIVSPPQVDVEEPLELSLNVHDNVGDPTCASDVTTEGTRVYVHLKEDPKTCAGVTRVYRIEGDHLIFEQELVD